jgi:Domain of unknown function (DUF4258)
MPSNVPANLLAMIRERVETRRVQIGAHAVRHGFAEGFRLRDVLTAARTGIIIEHYPDRGRCLMCARVRVGSGRLLWLHVVCDYNHPVMLDITTAYVPDPAEWEDPPVRRR